MIPYIHMYESKRKKKRLILIVSPRNYCVTIIFQQFNKMWLLHARWKLTKIIDTLSSIKSVFLCFTIWFIWSSTLEAKLSGVSCLECSSVVPNFKLFCFIICMNFPLPRFGIVHGLFISSQLRNCTIMNYKGMEYERLFAKYMIQNSRSL